MKALKTIGCSLSVWLLLSGTLSAQQFPVDGSVNIDIPGYKYATQGTQFGATTDIDKILRAQTGEYMNGLMDYAVEIQDLIVSYAKDQLMQTLAEAAGDAVPLLGGTIATKILKAYQESKDKDLASEIDKVKAVVKDAMSRELKIGYQRYKLRYAKFVAKAKAPTSIKNAPRKALVDEQIESMYPWEVAVIEQVYAPAVNGNVSQIEKWINSIHPNVDEFNMTAHTIGTAYGVIADKNLKTKLEMTNQEFDPALATANEVTEMRPFDRIRMRQELTKEVMQRKFYLKAMVDIINSSNGKYRRDAMREGLNEYNRLPSNPK